MPARKTAKRSSRSRQGGNVSSELAIQGKRVSISNLDKIFYPKAGFTKAQVIDYYIRISPALLPHLKGRPITLKRYPDGVEGRFFYEKRCPSHRPEWVKTTPVWSDRTQKEIHYCVADDLPTLVWAANLGDLELHTYLAKASDIDCPTTMVFDLDPGAPANILQCAEVGLLLKARFDRMKLESFIKTSGSKGMQVHVPLNTPASYDVTKPFARRLAECLARKHPKLIVASMSKNLRHGRVFVDWSQNDRHKTTVCVYSLRAKERPTISTPLTWDEVRSALKKKSIEALTFESEQALARVEKKVGDLFEPVLKLKQRVPDLDEVERDLRR